jgi:diguanylate cyclase (GGDEF)-like protein
MDFKKILDNYICKACILSVEKFPDGKYGNIRAVAGNRAHIEEVKLQTGKDFTENDLYTKYLPKSLNFEYYCYRSAILHQTHHSYIEIFGGAQWLEMYLIPIKSDEENIGYCLYTYSVTHRVDTGIMTDVPPDVSKAVLDSCIKLHGTKDFKETINEVIKDIRDICQARRCCVILVDEEARESLVLADSLREDYIAKRTGEMMNKGFYTTVEGWKDTMAGSSSLIVKNEQDRQIIKERNPVWYDALNRNTVETLVLFKLQYNDKLIGYIWASNFAVENVMKIKGVLELTSFFIASRIANYQLLTKLEKMSIMDALTGTKNRNAMNNRIAEFDNPAYIYPQSIGVIFADLNGLKKTNDCLGHAAGDRMLKKSGAMLQQVFVDEDIYRAGGDEFMIICMDVTDDEIKEKIAQLRKICDADKDVNFALGWCYETGKIDIRECMSLADRRMYEDKEEYYKKYPEKKYR